MSQNHGKPSSKNWDLTSPSKTLRELCATPTIKKIIQELGPDSDAYLVGGTVRDAILGMGEADIDLATKLAPLEVKNRLLHAGIKVVETGLQHGTVLAVIDDRSIEITSFRVPGDPQSIGTSIEQDLGGRDFTINAMAFSPSSGELLDPFGGVEDLKQNLIRAVGDPRQRFEEDPLRILRMVRFGAAQGRTVDPATVEVGKRLITSLKNVSVERIRLELEKMLTSAHPVEALRELRRIGALDLILPEMMPTYEFEQNKFHIHDVYEHTLWVIGRAPNNLIVRLAALFHDLGKPDTLSVDEDGQRHFYKHELLSADLAEKVMTRLRFSNDQIEAVKTLVRHHMRPLDCGSPGVRRILRDLGEHFEAWLQLKSADAPPVMPEPEFEAVKAQFLAMVETERTRAKGSVFGPLAIDGNDLIALGMKSGRDLGAVLKALEEEVIEAPERNEKDYLMTRAKEMILDLASRKDRA